MDHVPRVCGSGAIDSMVPTGRTLLCCHDHCMGPLATKKLVRDKNKRVFPCLSLARHRPAGTESSREPLTVFVSAVLGRSYANYRVSDKYVANRVLFGKTNQATANDEGKVDKATCSSLWVSRVRPIPMRLNKCRRHPSRLSSERAVQAR